MTHTFIGTRTLKAVISAGFLLLSACAGETDQSGGDQYEGDKGSAASPSDIQSVSSALTQPVFAVGCFDIRTTDVAIRASNGNYVVAEGGGGGAMNANRTSVGPWERFTVTDIGSNRIGLQTANGKWVVAEGGGGGQLLANRTAMGAWETFTANQVAPFGQPFKFTFTASNGNYVVAEGGGGGTMNANRTAAGPWETFSVVCYCGANPC